MRAVIQRVSTASVSVPSVPGTPDYAAAIGDGLLVYLGVERGDSAADVRYVIAKTAHLRIFEDNAGKMNRSVLDTRGAILVISQFTLHGDVRRGLRPSFNSAEVPGLAERLYEQVQAGLRELGVPVETGRFGAHMEVASSNSGPVTILIDSRKLF